MTEEVKEHNRIKMEEIKEHNRIKMEEIKEKIRKNHEISRKSND